MAYVRHHYIRAASVPPRVQHVGMRTRPPHIQGGFYHITMRGNGGQDIFLDQEDRTAYESRLGRALSKYGSQVHAYCWMTNHIHLLLRVQQAPAHKTVHHFATQYAQSFNKKYDRTGHLFHGRHWIKPMKTDGQLLRAVRYIHRNPLEACLVENLLTYRWSSLPAYLGHPGPAWLRHDFVLSMYGSQELAAQRTLLAYTLDRTLAQTVTIEPIPEKPSRAAAEAVTDWEELLQSTCAEFCTTRRQLRGPDTNRHLTLARCWLAKRAILSDVANLSTVAERLNRTPASLSRSLKRNENRLKEWESRTPNRPR